MTNKININYPRTKYSVLNNYIKEKTENIIDEFMEYAKEPTQENISYSLYIEYETYEYKNYISYVFFISMYTGGAHPDNSVLSINYNTQYNKIIKILNIYDNLNNLSKISRDLLRKNNQINSSSDQLNMILEGTEPDEYNFRNFAITENGIILFFEPYQVAPYVFGTIRITIPYNQLTANIN